jgi:hypothetical protein
MPSFTGFCDWREVGDELIALAKYFDLEWLEV